MDQAATERVLLALKILTSIYDPSNENSVTSREIEELKSHLGDEAEGLSADQIACTVIQREIKRQEDGTSEKRSDHF